MNQKLLHTPEGVRDIYGAELARKIQIETKLRECTRLFGYEEIQTPTFEFYDVFQMKSVRFPEMSSISSLIKMAIFWH
jgi:ATP phosphoribosyltransferase regulatory subunit